MVLAWAEEAVGIVGGEPKCCKSFLPLDLAVAVAAGVSCLRRFPVARPGRVLLYGAEDALHVVRQRLKGICVAAGVDLATLDVEVITAPTLRLDLEADRASLDETVATLCPRLLVLDPFVRLHRSRVVTLRPRFEVRPSPSSTRLCPGWPCRPPRWNADDSPHRRLPEAILRVHFEESLPHNWRHQRPSRRPERLVANTNTNERTNSPRILGHRESYVNTYIPGRLRSQCDSKAPMS